MTTKAEKERQKQIQDKCQTLLTQMLRDEDNKYCVDCDAKGPRWASWNLGVFLCIRCAGIHRNLGVHISKVKSVNLDSWTPEQVVSLQQMGNSRARAVYEANLPDNFRRPQGDSALEAFVRAKYEAKKYIAKEWVPPPIPKVNWDKELEEEAERGRKKKKDQKSAGSSIIGCAPGSAGHPPPVRKLDVIPQPLPKPNTSPKTSQRNIGTASAANTSANAAATGSNVAASASQQANGSAKPSTDLLGLDTPLSDTSGSASTDEMFTNFLSAPPISGPSCAKRTPEEESFFNQPSSNAGGAMGAGEKKQMTTDSILALYGKTPVQPPTASLIAGGFTVPAGGVQGGFPAAALGGTAFQAAPTGYHQMPNGMIPVHQQMPPGSGLPQGGVVMQGAPTGAGGMQACAPGIFGQAGVPPGMMQAPVGAAVASNPFYNMSSTQPMNFNAIPTNAGASGALNVNLTNMQSPPPQMVSGVGVQTAAAVTASGTPASNISPAMMSRLPQQMSALGLGTNVPILALHHHHSRNAAQLIGNSMAPAQAPGGFAAAFGHLQTAAAAGSTNAPSSGQTLASNLWQ